MFGYDLLYLIIVNVVRGRTAVVGATVLGGIAVAGAKRHLLFTTCSPRPGASSVSIIVAITTAGVVICVILIIIIVIIVVSSRGASPSRASSRVVWLPIHMGLI